MVIRLSMSNAFWILITKISTASVGAYSPRSVTPISSMAVSAAAAAAASASTAMSYPHMHMTQLNSPASSFSATGYCQPSSTDLGHHYPDMRTSASAASGWYSSPAADPRFASEYCKYIYHYQVLHVKDLDYLVWIGFSFFPTYWEMLLLCINTFKTCNIEVHLNTTLESSMTLENESYLKFKRGSGLCPPFGTLVQINTYCTSWTPTFLNVFDDF